MPRQPAPLLCHAVTTGRVTRGGRLPGGWGRRLRSNSSLPARAPCPACALAVALYPLATLSPSTVCSRLSPLLPAPCVLPARSLAEGGRSLLSPRHCREAPAAPRGGGRAARVGDNKLSLVLDRQPRWPPNPLGERPQEESGLTAPRAMAKQQRGGEVERGRP